MHEDRDLPRSQVVATSGWQGVNDGRLDQTAQKLRR